MTAAEMCSECISPARWHHPDSTYGDAGQVSGPCPGWPRRAQQIRKLRQDLLALPGRPSPPPQPKPEPLAVIPSGLPIEEALTQLASVQAAHSGALARRGSRNRWEIWPAQGGRGARTGSDDQDELARAAPRREHVGPVKQYEDR